MSGLETSTPRIPEFAVWGRSSFGLRVWGLGLVRGSSGTVPSPPAANTASFYYAVPGIRSLNPKPRMLLNGSDSRIT